MNHTDETLGELVVSGGNGAVDFQSAKHPFDWVALFIQRAIIFHLHAAVCSAGNDGFDIAAGKIITNGIRIVALISKKRLWRLLG